MNDEKQTEDQDSRIGKVGGDDRPGPKDAVRPTEVTADEDDTQGQGGKVFTHDQGSPGSMAKKHG